MTMKTTTRPLNVSKELYLACQYFLPRLMFWQSEWGDLVLALKDFPQECNDISSSEFWQYWMKGWSDLGDLYVAQAETALHHTGQRDLFRSATNCYHWAEFMYFADPLHKGKLRQQVKDCFIKSWDANTYPLEMGEMEWNGIQIPYYLLLPNNTNPNSESFPCVILSNGLDSVTEVEIIAFARHFLNRGLAVFLFDGPGQGINLGRYPIPVAFEEVIASVVDNLQSCPQIDANCLGFFGVSYGGYIALRVAQHLGDCFKAVVNLSGGPYFTPFENMKRRLKDDFQYAFMETNQTAMLNLFEQLQLNLSDNCQTNVLSIHGELDDIFPVRGIRELDNRWGARHQSIIYQQEAHVCLNLINQYVVTLADWMWTQLTTKNFSLKP